MLWGQFGGWRHDNLTALGLWQCGIPTSIELMFPQDAVVRAFRNSYPEEVFQGFQFPVIEDLINAFPFTTYREWRHEQHMEALEELGPALVSRQQIFTARYSSGQQQGAFSHKATLPPLISYQVDKDTHFSRAIQLGKEPSPLEREMLVDDDLEFAADMMCTHAAELGAKREESMQAMEELGRRWQVVDDHLRSHQCASLEGVTSERALGLVGLLYVLTMWPDARYPCELWQGVKGVGFNPWCRVYPFQDAALVNNAYVSEGGLEEAQRLAKSTSASSKVFTVVQEGINKQVGYDEFILSESMKDYERGWCTQPMSWKAMRQHTKGRKDIRTIRRKVVQQPSGKLRLIDDADEGGQSATSEDCNKLRLCSALRPAQHAAILYKRAAKRSMLAYIILLGLLSGGEDWPDAYRHTPMRPEDSYMCIVSWWHPTWGMVVYQRYYSLLFGLPLAVTNFNRYPRWTEAIVRRFVFILFSMYFDDGTIQDLGTEKEAGQDMVGRLMTVLGTPFAPSKRQPMGVKGTFLGLCHDTSMIPVSGNVSFWPKPSLCEKIVGYGKTARASRSFPPGLASKYYGSCNFFESGAYGKIGRSGLNAIKDRQTEKSNVFTEEIDKSMRRMEDIIMLHPRRQLQVWPGNIMRFTGASDAAYESSRGSGGFLVVTYEGVDQQIRMGKEVEISDGIYQYWGDHETYISQLEMLMILVALIDMAPILRGRRGIWYVDNVAALMAMVRGRANSPDLDRMAEILQGAMFALGIWLYFEWVESDANWSDGISREGLKDEWHMRNGFRSSRCGFLAAILQLPLVAVIKVFEFV